MGRKILITGGLGLLGKPLVTFLREKKYSIYVLDKSKSTQRAQSRVSRPFSCSVRAFRVIKVPETAFRGRTGHWLSLITLLGAR